MNAKQKVTSTSTMTTSFLSVSL